MMDFGVSVSVTIRDFVMGGTHGRDKGPMGGVSNSGELGSICLQFTLYKCVNFSYQYPISIIID